MSDRKPLVTRLVRTCNACPSQWDGTLDDGRLFYARYRFGGFSLRISNTPGADPHDDGEEVMDEEIGGEYDGDMTDEEMQRLTQDRFTWVDA